MKKPVMWLVVGLLELVLALLTIAMVVIAGTFHAAFFLFAFCWVLVVVVVFEGAVECMIKEEGRYGC